jgi:lysozyme family protein
MAQWERCYPLTLKFEGGFQDNPKDVGNWTGGEVGQGDLKGTKFGISASSYPEYDIKSLTEEKAIEIYHRDFWNYLHLTCIISDRVAWKVFDIAVNCGTRTAAKMVQNAVGVLPDGIIGEVTLRAINLSEPIDVLNKLVNLQQIHYAKINERYKEKHGEDHYAYKGWMVRSENIAPELEEELCGNL